MVYYRVNTRVQLFYFLSNDYDLFIEYSMRRRLI